MEPPLLPLSSVSSLVSMLYLDFPWDYVPLLYKKQNSKQYRAHPIWCRGIFYALNLISAGMSPLKDLPQFKEYMVTLGQNPILGVVAGAVITVLIQASSATTGFCKASMQVASSTLKVHYQFSSGIISGQPNSYHCGSWSQCLCKARCGNPRYL